MLNFPSSRPPLKKTFFMLFSAASILFGWVLKNVHARNGNDHHTSASLPFRNIYLQLLLQDFNKDFMLISKNTESCRLNIVSQSAARTAAAAAAEAAAAAAAVAATAAVLLIYLSKPLSPLSSPHRQQSFGPQCLGFITVQSRSDAQL